MGCRCLRKRSRAGRVQGACKPGQEGVNDSKQVLGETCAVRQEFDEGHFYSLDSWLALHCAGQTCSSTQAKVAAVQALNQFVVRDPKGRARLELVW